MRSAAFLCPILLTTLVLAGCAGGGDSKDVPASSSVPVGSAVYESEDLAATVSGTVTDDEKVPIAGVTMTLVELNLEVLSGEGGNYEFQNVPLGTYKIGANKLGYSAAFKQVEVKEGNATVKADFLLEPIIIREARMTTQIWNGKITCGILLVPVCGIFDELNQKYGTPNPTNEKWLFPFKYEGEEVPVGMVTEMDWKPSAPGTAAQMSPYIIVGGSLAQGKSGPSPIKIASDEDQVKSWFKKDKAFGVYPTLTDALIDQKFTVYRTDFYGVPPAENWTIYPS